MIKIVVLDRDGVINQDSPLYIKSLAEWVPIPGSLEAIARLCFLGYIITIATNQSGVGRGYLSLETLHSIHLKMLRMVREFGGKIADIFCCLHKPDDGCSCRKPQPGLLLQIVKQFKVMPNELIMIGDSFSDIMAAKSCGAKAIFVKSGNKSNDLMLAKQAQIPIYENLLAITDDLSKDKMIDTICS